MNQRHAIILQHVPFEGPGRIVAALERAGITPELRRLFAGDPLPSDLPRETLLVIMGGPMGVGDIGAPAYPYLEREARLLQARIEDDSPTLGICLGAQLIAHATGAPVYPNRRPLMPLNAPAARILEVGWAPVSFDLATRDPVLDGLPGRAHMFHWHGDTFDLPRQAVLLASSDTCRNQAFRLRRRLFGLQFHCEVDAPDVQALLGADPEFAVAANGPDAAALIIAATARHAPEHRAVGDRLLANLIRAMTE
jgi:GMP synthase-like glutamine amidotransferase